MIVKVYTHVAELNMCECSNSEALTLENPERHISSHMQAHKN